jgi:hypothetical protein
MNLFTPSETIGWSFNDQGLAVFFNRRRDYERSSKGAGKAYHRRIFEQFQRLLECGEADVESTHGGIFIVADDAVRLDRETRELFGLPRIWPGYFRLETHSVPNLDDFDAVLRLIDFRGHSIPRWSLKGPVLEIVGDHFVPDSPQFACLRAFEQWKSISGKREADHLRFIHVLTEAAGEGCRVDVSQAGRIHPVTATECCVDAEEQPDGSLLLTPVPLFSGLQEILGDQFEKSDDPQTTYEYYRKAIVERLGQLEVDGTQAIFRIGPLIIVLDETQTEQAREIARTSRVPQQQTNSFRKDPAKWLAENVFVHGLVEFLPRVIGIGEWSGGYLGAAGELGEKIDWFDKKPEPEPAPKKDSDGSKEGDHEQDRDSDPDEDKD